MWWFCFGEVWNERNSPSDASIYRDLDTNNDGGLGHDEIRKYIQDEIGGQSFDETEEISAASLVAFKRLDTDRDGLIEQTDLKQFWTRTTHGLRTVDETASWVEHAVQLPQYAPAFRSNAIVGSDFPWLLEKNGDMLLNDVGVKSELHRNKLLRCIRMVVLGIGHVPSAPSELTGEYRAEGITLQWTASSDSGIPAHRYELQRRNSSTTVWQTLYAESSFSYSDAAVRLELRYAYRVRAWNMVGHSKWGAETEAESGTTKQLSTFVTIIVSMSLFFKLVGGPMKDIADTLRSSPLNGDDVPSLGAATISSVPAPHLSLSEDLSDDDFMESSSMPTFAKEHLDDEASKWNSQPDAPIERARSLSVDTQKKAMLDIDIPTPTPQSVESPSSDGSDHVEHPSLVKLKPVRSGQTPKDRIKRCENNKCNAKFRLVGPWRHQCRRCLKAKCNACTIVGCFGVCGDKCVCYPCAEEEQRLQKRYLAKSA